MEEILVVDDDFATTEVMIYLLQSEGYCVRSASNGEAALQLLAARPVALVLTDYMMPSMDGCELLQTMLRSGELAATPVIMVTALPEDVVRDKCQPVTAFLRKPFHVAQLLQSVRNVVGPGTPFGLDARSQVSRVMSTSSRR